ncbi:MAG: Major facilitator superfamily [Patescibacteria group bacterium]|nr:Major facilitator superfamily [Patescibacteria group bacterium]
MLTSLNHHRHSLAFANKEITEMFAYQVFKELAFGLVSIFVPIYLLIHHVPLFWIMVAFTGRSLIHGITAHLIGRIALLKIGIKHTFVITTILYIASFAVIRQGTAPEWIALWAAITAVANALYSCSYHSFLSLKMDERSAGREVALMAIISMVVGIATPLVGAVLISIFGFKYMFMVGSGFLFLAVIPLLFSPEIPTEGQVHLRGFSHYRAFWKSNRDVVISTLGNGFDGSSDPIWDSLYLYKLFGGLRALGAMTSVVSFVQMCAHYVGGRRVDQKKSGFSLGISGSIFSRILVFASFHPYIAIMSETMNSVIRPLFSTAFSTAFYRKLRGANTISFVAAHETIWHSAHVVAMIVITIGVYFIGWYAFLISGAFMILGKLMIRSQRVGADEIEKTAVTAV